MFVAGSKSGQSSQKKKEAQSHIRQVGWVGRVGG